MRDTHPLPGTDVVVTGTRLHVVCHGRAEGRPLLLLHGLPTTSYLWRDVQRDLEHDHRSLAPDLFGLGRSERATDQRPDIAGQARLLLRLLDHQSLDRVAIAGHDLGGSVAVALAALAPERVGALVLVDAPVHAEVWPVPAVLPLLLPVVGDVYAAGLRAVPPAARALLARALGVSGASPLTGRELDHYLAPLLAPGGAAHLVRVVRAVDLATVEAAWRLLQATPPPTLVLWGERDRLHAASYGRRVAGELGASWVPVADAGHLLPQERPERVAEEIAGFLAELPNRPGGAI